MHEKMAQWLTILGFVFTVWLSMTPLATGSCPAVNTAANCSFEPGDSCLKAYRTHDRHGLKWTHNSGQLAERTLVNTQYGYTRYQTEVQLDASPRDWYMYIPATTDPRAVGLWTDLVSPPLTIDRQGCLYFLFHNNVCGDPADPLDTHFRVMLHEYSDLQGLVHTGTQILRDYPCIDDSAWYRAQIPIHGLNGIFRIVFAAKQHDIENKTIAVDHVTYSDQSCSIRSDDNFKDGDCGFEDADLCGYQQAKSENETTPLEWRAVQKEMFSGRQNGTVQAPDGYFVCLWGVDDRTQEPVATVELSSPQIYIPYDGCLSVMYFSGRYDNDNGGIAALRVVVEDSSGTKSLLYEFPATLGDEPMRAFVTLPRGRSVLHFAARVVVPYGEDWYDVICLDDVEIHQKACDEIRCDDHKCEEDTVSLTSPCNYNGQCLGNGLKHKSCLCNLPSLGKNCEENPELPRISPTRRNPWDRYPYY